MREETRIVDTNSVPSKPTTKKLGVGIISQRRHNRKWKAQNWRRRTIFCFSHAFCTHESKKIAIGIGLDFSFSKFFERVKIENNNNMVINNDVVGKRN